MPDAAHRFTEAEVRAIFEEAARRQAARQAAAAPGLTLAELQAVAAETGLDPDLVAAAAAHLPEDAPETKSYPLWDVPEEVRVERVIPGGSRTSSGSGWWPSSAGRSGRRAGPGRSAACASGPRRRAQARPRPRSTSRPARKESRRGSSSPSL
jgi:hypothetical protein